MEGFRGEVSEEAREGRVGEVDERDLYCSINA